MGNAAYSSAVLGTVHMLSLVLSVVAGDGVDGDSRSDLRFECSWESVGAQSGRTQAEPVVLVAHSCRWHSCSPLTVACPDPQDASVVQVRARVGRLEVVADPSAYFPPPATHLRSKVICLSLKRPDCRLSPIALGGRQEELWV